MKVTVYTTQACPYCREVKDLISRCGISFLERDVSLDKAAAEEMIRKSGQMGVPVTVIDDQVVVGFDRPRLESLLAGWSNGRRIRFGLQVANASKVALKYGVPAVPGAIVGYVAPSSIGDQAGLRRGDIITELDAQPIRSANELEEVISCLTPGNRVTIVWLRGVETLRGEVTVS